MLDNAFKNWSFRIALDHKKNVRSFLSLLGYVGQLAQSLGRQFSHSEWLLKRYHGNITKLLQYTYDAKRQFTTYRSKKAFITKAVWNMFSSHLPINLLLICSTHLFSWQAGREQRQLKGTIAVRRAVSPTGNVKETQKLCPLQHGSTWQWWLQATGFCPHDWLEEPSPGSRGLWPWPTPKEGGCHAGLGPRGVPGAAPWGWSCWWPHLQALSCDWGTKGPDTGAVGGDEQTG